MPEPLPVIFRAQKEGGTLWITAVFPTLIGTTDPNTFTVYQHVGQHGSGSLSWYRRTRPARPAEYADLWSEIKRIYEPDVRLVIRQRMHAGDRRIRQQQA